ncbi:MAG: hypothetical protein P9M00_09050 [Candidatus Tritonobacter lacicola]|nr:hypothetical protein [Candidatus Tritonobacter lacicola]
MTKKIIEPQSRRERKGVFKEDKWDADERRLSGLPDREENKSEEISVRRMPDRCENQRPEKDCEYLNDSD